MHSLWRDRWMRLRGSGSGGRLPLLATALLAGVVVAGCGAALTPKAAAPSGVVTFAQSPGSPPTYIFPLYDGANSGNNNITYLQPLMWRPLYWFGHANSAAPTINYPLSLAGPPAFSNAGKTVTVTLKPYLWSDGQPVTTRDVEFFLNLLLADKPEFVSYAPGDWMDHLAGIHYASPTKFSMTFTRPYSSTYVLGNILAVITPIPQHAWDKTSGGGTIGNHDLTSKGAVAVYKYLNAQSGILSQWDTSPLWQVVDGPFRLQRNDGFDATNGYVIMVPNSRYSGPDKPHIAKFEEVPFSSDTAELDALLSGRVDYGYLPFTDLTLRSRLNHEGFRIASWLDWGFTSVGITFANRTVGPVLQQLYVRQAMQHLINQPEYIKQIFKGYAEPIYGPIPVQPASPYLSPYVKGDPFPYSPTAARRLLSSNGWHVVENGTSTCAHPGTGAGECGAGVTRGEGLRVNIIYTAGNVAYAQEMQGMQTSFAQAGIQLTLRSAPYNEVLTLGYACNPVTGTGCGYSLGYLGSPNWTYVPVYFPVDSPLIQDTSLIYKGNPSFISRVLQLINASDQSSSLQDVYRYENYMAKELPYLWLPNASYQISAISKKLHGVVAQDSTGHIYPEDWTLTG